MKKISKILSSVLVAVLCVIMCSAAITSGWVTKRLTIDPRLKTWEAHGTYMIGSTKFNTSYSTTSQDLISQMTNNPVVVQAVFDEVEDILLAKMQEDIESKLNGE